MAVIKTQTIISNNSVQVTNVHVGHVVKRGVFRGKRRQNEVSNVMLYSGDSRITCMCSGKKRNASSMAGELDATQCKHTSKTLLKFSDKIQSNLFLCAQGNRRS